MKQLILAIGLFCLSAYANALTYPLYSGSDIVGTVVKVYMEPGDTLGKIAKRFGLTYAEMRKANPHIHHSRPKPWSIALVPTGLPDAPRRGIVINLPELRLYYFPPGRNEVMVFPLGIGREGWHTPTVRTHIIEMTINPYWNVPESIQEYMLEKYNKELPDIMPPGPENPLGDYALRLAIPGYLIHGTNDPSSVGRRSSSGCIRMRPEDVELLFSRVRLRTSVQIVNQPYKVGWYDGELFIEAHAPFEDQPPPVFEEELTALQVAVRNATEGRDIEVDWNSIHRATARSRGYPRNVGFESTSMTMEPFFQLVP